MRGIIVINPYHVPKENVLQANRLKEEFDLLGVDVKIVDDGFTRAYLSNNQIVCTDDGIDFVLYLDKDKYLSKELTEKGFRLFNSHDSIRVCDDKGETYIALANKGIKIPDTVFGALCYRDDCEALHKTADVIIEKLGLPIVVKESFGSLGTGVFKADDKDSLLTLMEKVRTKPHLFQKYIPYKVGADVRVIVVGRKAICSMLRVNDQDFRSNIALGGRGEKIVLTKEFKEVAEKTAKVLGLDYCGVDLLYGEDDVPYVCEVNSNAFFLGIEKVTGVNVAKAYAEYIINQVKK